MRIDDAYMLSCLNTGELAFQFSKFIKYGEEGKVKFMRSWFRQHIKKVKDKDEQKFLQKRFKKYKSDLDFLRFWELAVKSFSALDIKLKEVASFSDKKRLESLAEFCKTLKYNITLGGQPNGSNNIFVTPEDISKLQNGNIPKNTISLFIEQKAINHEEINVITNELQDYGFSITEQDRKGNILEYKIASAFHCELIKKIYGRG